MKNLFLNSHGGWSRIADPIWSPATQKQKQKFSLFKHLHCIEASKISGVVLLTLFTNLIAKQNVVNSCCWLMLDCCQTQFEAQPPRNLWPEPPSLKPLSSSPSLLKGLKLMLFWNSNILNLLNKSTNQFFKTQGIIQPAYLFHADCVCKQQSCWRLDPVLFKLQLKCQSSAEEEIEWMTFDRSNTMNLRNQRRKWMC